MKRLELVIRGQVQGVGYRFAAKAEADRLRLVGYVANRADRSVELVAEGNETNLHQLLHWAHQGPVYASIEAVEAKWGEPLGEFLSFEIQI